MEVLLAILYEMKQSTKQQQITHNKILYHGMETKRSLTLNFKCGKH